MVYVQVVEAGVAAINGYVLEILLNITNIIMIIVQGLQISQTLVMENEDVATPQFVTKEHVIQ